MWLAVGIAVVFLSLVFLILWLFPGESPRCTVPGMQPHADQNGNLSDIGKAGSLHEFLMELHKEFGPIASFWWGKTYTVSIASYELFKEHQHVFDRPVEPFMMFEPMLTPHSISYANGADGRLRRQAYDKVFNYDGLHIYYDMLQKVADEVCSKWEHADVDDHFPLRDHMFMFAIKGALISLLGDRMKEDKEAMSFKMSYDVAWEEMEQRLTNPVPPAENSTRMQNFQEALANMKDTVLRVIKARERKGRESRDFLLIDAIIGHHADDADRRTADTLTYLVGGFHTTGTLLTWCIYFLCMHDDCQEKLYQEIVDVLGTNEPVTHQSMGRLKYMRQVMDETLRCAVIAPWAARYSDQDVELGGHKIYARTPVIHALGVSLMDEKVWPAPTVFDPERFSEKRSKGRPTIAFSPFGFAGHRQCPGYRFAYVEAAIMLVTAMQKFRFLLVPGQEVKPHYSLITQPKEEIWFKVAKRG